MKVWITALILFLAAGCGSSDETSKNTEESVQQEKVSPSLKGSASSGDVEAAHALAQKGQVNMLREMLAQNPSIANGAIFRDDNLLNVVIDTRPEFPNMHGTIKVLLEAGGDPNRNAPELLRKAIWRGDPESLELLLEFGADPTVVSSKKKMNMLDYARSTGDERFEPILQDWEARHR